MSNIKSNTFVGIPNCIYKTKLIKNRKHAKVVEISLPGLAGPDCFRHFEIINRFDNFGKPNLIADFNESCYVKYYKNLGRSNKYIFKKIRVFYNLYISIRDGGFKYNGKYIFVTTDNLRLDGSHRSAIVEYLGFKKIKVKILDWKKYLSKRDAKVFASTVSFQKKFYNLYG